MQKIKAINLSAKEIILPFDGKDIIFLPNQIVEIEILLLKALIGDWDTTGLHRENEIRRINNISSPLRPRDKVFAIVSNLAVNVFETKELPEKVFSDFSEKDVVNELLATEKLFEKLDNLPKKLGRPKKNEGGSD